MPARKTKSVHPIFKRVRDFIRRYSVIAEDQLNVVTTWAIGTWAFSPACQWPATYPYLYITGPAGSGKTVLGQDALGCLTRSHTSATGATGSTLFRMLGIYDDETGEVENLAPTLFLDEIDTTYSGAKDADLQRALDVGYKRGATIPRAAGKSFIAFPVYGPKLLMGIDNGHLPEPLLQRCIRIDLQRQSQDQLAAAGVEPFYIFDVEEEAAELQQQLSDFMKEHSFVLREYRPAAPKGLSARNWEIARSLVQIAHAIGNEAEIITSLVSLFAHKPTSGKTALYRTVFDLFESTDEDRLTTQQILAALSSAGVGVPGNSGKGLASVLMEDGVSPQMIRLREDHSAYDPAHASTQRGYYRHQFDRPFVKYLSDDDEAL